MSESWYRFAIKEIERSSRRKTDFEKKFIESVKSQVERGVRLSEKQEAVLMKIRGKMTDVAVRR